MQLNYTPEQLAPRRRATCLTDQIIPEAVQNGTALDRLTYRMLAQTPQADEAISARASQ